MRLSIAIASLAALAAAAPTPKRSLKARQNGPVLADTTFDDISISGGTAGNAEEEALAVFSALDLDNLANIDPADIEFLGAVNDVANDAETDAFNPAIEAATGDEATALQNGKIKNKVLKLMATKIELEAQAAQGEDTAAKLEEELTKLNNNIALDQEAAGQPSTAVAFDATISGGGNAAAANANANNNVVAGGAADDADADAEDVATGNGNANAGADEEDADADAANADTEDAADADAANADDEEADAEEADAEEADAEETAAAGGDDEEEEENAAGAEDDDE